MHRPTSQFTNNLGNVPQVHRSIRAATSFGPWIGNWRAGLLDINTYMQAFIPRLLSPGSCIILGGSRKQEVAGPASSVTAHVAASSMGIHGYPPWISRSPKLPADMDRSENNAIVYVSGYPVWPVPTIIWYVPIFSTTAAVWAGLHGYVHYSSMHARMYVHTSCRPGMHNIHRRLQSTLRMHTD